MKEQKRVFHGKRKWICPGCSRVKMVPVNKGKKEGRRINFNLD